MVKIRSYEKRRNKKILMYSIIILSILTIFGVFYFESDSSQELTISDDTSRPPNHYDFATMGYSGDVNQMFVFVDRFDDVFSFVNARYLRSAGISYYTGNNNDLEAGKGCNQNELIRFTFCDNAYDKTTCQDDIFSNWWYVNYNDEYINFAEYYTGDTEGFYYTYSCYESSKYSYISVDDNFEKKFLYDNTCISKESPNYINGIDYGTEDKCLDAISSNEISSDTCEYKLYDDYTCVGSNLYQKERFVNCDKGYTKFVTKCYYGCSEGSCLPTPDKTCSYEEFDNFKCVDGVLYQEVQQRNCDIGFTLPIEECKVDDSGDINGDDDVSLSDDKSDFDCFVCEENKLNFETLSMFDNWECQEYNNILYTNDEATCQALRPELFEEKIINENIECFICENNYLNTITLNMPIDWKCQKFNDVLYVDNVDVCMALKPQLFDDDKSNDDDEDIVICEDYEKNVNGVCEFSFAKLGTTKGIEAYYKDYTGYSIIIVIATILLSAQIGNVIKKKMGGNKK